MGIDAGIGIGMGAASVGRGGRTSGGGGCCVTRSAPGGDVVVSDGPSPSPAASSTPTMKSPM